MIIRHMPMKSVRKSNAIKLVEYITNSQGKHERVGSVRVTNCHNSNLMWAAHEIAATQSKNQRTKNDKSYHLLISFAPGESPTSDVLKAIEDKVVASVGFSEHQRVSAVHHDTDNVHIHVAINKIHPQKLTMVEPYRAYKTFAEIATQLEIEYGLQITNHKAKKVRSENMAEDMEHHASIESLLGWIKRHCLEQLEQCKNWADFHNILESHGLEIKPQGNGLVISHGDALMVKASSVSRRFSKQKLEEHLGIFQPKESDKRNTSRQRHYDYQPLNKRAKSSELYAQYHLERTTNKQVLTNTLASCRQRKNRLIEQAKHLAHLKRTAVKLTKNDRLSKKLIYSLISKSLLEKIGKIKRQCSQERDHLITKHRNYTWADWLQKKALEGNVDALQLMRHRKPKQQSSYQLSGSQSIQSPIITKETDSITKEGTVIYRVGECAIRDNGKALNISRGVSVEGLKTALEMANQKFGSCISVSGTKLFKKTILQVAVKYQLPLTFDDPAMENQRQQLITPKEATNEQSIRSKPGRSIRRGNETIRANSRIRGNKRTRIGVLPAARAKPYPSGIRQIPPPQSNNSLRNLSELGMVQLTRRSEVFLPSNAHDMLERQRAQPNNHVRRSVFGIKIGTNKKSKSHRDQGL